MTAGLRCAVVLASVVLMPFVGSRVGAEEKELSLEETRARLTARVAERLEVAATDIAVVEAEARTWPDAGLGCPGRRRFVGDAPVEGYRFVLAVGERRFTYHTDRRARFLRCDGPRKPLGPISR